MRDPAIWVAALSCVAGCYFAAASMALRDFNRPKLAERLERWGRRQRLEAFLARVDRLALLTALLRSGFNLAVVLSVLYALHAAYINVWPAWLVYVVAFAIAGAAVTVFGVAVASGLANHYAEELLARSMAVLMLAHRLASPLIRVLEFLDRLVRRLGGERRPTDPNEELTDQVLSAVAEHDEGGQVDEAQKEMIEAVFELRSTTAGQIMTPRTDVIGIPAEADLARVKQIVIDSGVSRFPVYGANLDEIVGILYAKDLIQFLAADGNTPPFELRRVLRQALMVPQTKPVRELLADFQAHHVHLAIVLDEYGGTAGLVTVEDVVEEIVGEIQDEYERAQPQPSFVRVDENTIQADARTAVSELNDELDLELPEDEDYSTLGGFVLSSLGHIPEAGEHFDYGSLRLTVTAAERTRVKTVRIETPVQARVNGEAGDESTELL